MPNRSNQARISILASSVACATTWSLALAARAAGTDLAWDDAACGKLSVGQTSRSGTPGALRVENYHATLAASGGDSPAHLEARALRTDGPASLETLPDLFAGGLMVGLQKHKPAGCDLQHGFERAAELVADLPEGAKADQRWSTLHVVAGGNTLQASTLTLHVESLPDDIMRVSEELSGFSNAGGDQSIKPIGQAVIRVSARRSQLQKLARGGEMAPTDTVQIEKILMTTGDSRIDAHGIYHPATRSGHMEVVATNMEGLRDAVPASERDKVGAAFLILRLTARHQGDDGLAWSVDWPGRSIAVNGVSLPTSF